MSATVVRIEPAQGHTLHVEAPTQPLWTPSRNGDAHTPAPAPSAEILAMLVKNGEDAERVINSLLETKDQYLQLLRMNAENARAMVNRVRLRLEEYDAETEKLCGDLVRKAREARARLGEARRAADDARVRGMTPEGPNVEVLERELSDIHAEDRSLVANRLLTRETLEDLYFRSVHGAVHCTERLWERAERQLAPLEAIATGGKRAAEMLRGMTAGTAVGNSQDVHGSHTAPAPY